MELGGLSSRAWNEGYPKVCEDFPIMEKAHTSALNMKAVVAAFNQ